MNRRQCLQMMVMTLSGMIMGVPGVRADDIKARMKARLPIIVALKNKGLVGETARGYLAYVTDEKVQPDVIDAENSDRRTVYRRIADQQGVSLEKVEQLRALQIVKKAGKGEYLQKPDGSWYKK